ncbi:MAG TPA: zf-HC2 domain-containing protein [Longimicrobiales bacterium]
MSQTTCREALARLYEYLDGELTRETAERIREHIQICECCFPSFRFAQSFHEMLRRVSNGQPAAPDHLRRRVAELLRTEGLEPEA